MKTVLTAVNARFVHSSLALRYLKQYNPEFDIRLAEFSLNDNIWHMLDSLEKEKAEVYGFSCYIWNMEPILKLAEMLKKAVPNTFVFLGGPEAGCRAEEILKSYPFIDGVMVGEGEQTLKELLGRFADGILPDALPMIPGLMHRRAAFEPRRELDLASVPLPYTEEDLPLLQGKIVYFETSRGCPFHCAYCLSAAEKTVRAFPMEYVKKGLSMLFLAGVPLVKLIDRTFNYDNSRAMEILRFILEESRNTCVHMELEPQILTPELTALLGSAPKDRFQAEIGIQSANEKTLQSVGRSCNLKKIAENIWNLRQYGNMHIHLDLIAGLPYEDYASFGRSFDFVYHLRPDMLQLGFLKVLPGTPVCHMDGIVAQGFPPYQVISTKWMDPDSMRKLREIEAAVEMFYNSGAFVKTVKQLVSEDDRPFSVFETLAGVLVQAEKKGKRKRRELYSILYQVYGESLREALSEDFIRYNQNVPLPAFVHPQREKGFKDKTYQLMKNDVFCRTYGIVPDLARLRFERMDGKAYMMDYASGKLWNITMELDAEIDRC